MAALWGRRLLQSRILFLAGSDVLHQPVDKIAALLSAIGQTFPIEPRTRGTHDRSSRQTKTSLASTASTRSWTTSRCPGPTATAGESWPRGAWCGSASASSRATPRCGATYHKSWADDELRATIADSKAAGLGVSVLTLVGAGGVERAEPHVERTVRLIESLELGAGDFVFLLDEKEIREPESSRLEA